MQPSTRKLAPASKCTAASVGPHRPLVNTPKALRRQKQLGTRPPARGGKSECVAFVARSSLDSCFYNETPLGAGQPRFDAGPQVAVSWE